MRRALWTVLLLLALCVPGSAGIHMHTSGSSYSDEQAQDAVGTICTDTSTIDCTYNDAVPSISAIVIDDSITYAKMQNVSAASRLLGSGDAGAGINPVEITLGSGLAMTGTTLSSTATISGGAANKVAYWTGATTLSNDTALHWDATTDMLGLGATAAGTSGVGVFVLGLGTSPTTGVTDAVQLYARDYAAGLTGLAVLGESDTTHLLGRSLLTGTTTLSSSMVKGHLIEQDANDDGILQFQSTGDVAHGMTSLGSTALYGDVRKIVAANGGLQIRGLTEATMGLYLSSIVTTVTSTKSNAADAAIILESGLKDTTTVQGHAADTNLVAIQNRFTTPKTQWIVDTDGDTWQSGAVTAQRTIEASTAGSGAPNVLGAADESNKVLTNEGSTAQNYHTLPAAAVTNGSAPQYTFVVQDADGLRITAGTGDTIRIAAAVSGAAGRCESTTIGDSVTVVAINAVEWMAIAVVGAGWTCT